MRNVEGWIGFFETTDETAGRTNFNGHYATGVILRDADQTLEPLQCVVFGRARFVDSISYRMRISYLGRTINADEPFEMAGTVDRVESIDGEWTFQLLVGIKELDVDADLVIRAEAMLGDELVVAHLKIARSSEGLKTLTELMTAPSEPV